MANVEHRENEYVAILDKDHSNQKNYRDSCAVWLTIPAMAKIQKVYGVSENTINQNRAIMLIAKKAGVELISSDLDRSKEALMPKIEAVKADAISEEVALREAINPLILQFFKAGFTENQIKELMRSCDFSDTEIAIACPAKVVELTPLEKFMTAVKSLQKK